LRLEGNIAIVTGQLSTVNNQPRIWLGSGQAQIYPQQAIRPVDGLPFLPHLPPPYP
jgi:hypothetical protein